MRECYGAIPNYVLKEFLMTFLDRKTSSAGAWLACALWCLPSGESCTVCTVCGLAGLAGLGAGAGVERE